MGSGDITDISIVTIVGIDIVRICGFYVIVERYPGQLLLSDTVSSPDSPLIHLLTLLINVCKHTTATPLCRFGWKHSKFNYHPAGLIMKYVLTFMVQACSYRMLVVLLVGMILF